MSYECSEYMFLHLNIHNSSTPSHASEEEIALEIAAKIASVNGPLEPRVNHLNNKQ
jgi:hypothetical protein